ncbi:MAG: hypothetical protein M3Y49_11750 [Actinomycetota bacterium]|nr:hypothetical protein [Actinomycetota bacterium]
MDAVVVEWTMETCALVAAVADDVVADDVALDDETGLEDGAPVLLQADIASTAQPATAVTAPLRR